MFFRQIVLGAALAFVGYLGPIDAMATELITFVADDAVTSKNEESTLQISAQQLARIDVDGVVSALSASRGGGVPVVLNLFPGISVPLVLDREDPAPKDMSAFAAHSPGDIASSATIVVSKGTVYAIINYNRETYEISYLANGIHRIKEIDQSKYPGDKVIEGVGRSLPALPSNESLKSIGVAVAAKPAGERQDAVEAAKTVISVTIVATLKARTHHPN